MMERVLRVGFVKFSIRTSVKCTSAVVTHRRALLNGVMKGADVPVLAIVVPQKNTLLGIPWIGE
jgi:hypothetical protein